MHQSVLDVLSRSNQLKQALLSSIDDWQELIFFWNKEIIKYCNKRAIKYYLVFHAVIWSAFINRIVLEAFAIELKSKTSRLVPADADADDNDNDNEDEDDEDGYKWINFLFWSISLKNALVDSL